MYVYPDYLVHYGVKGMKWGVRRKVNSDGTLKRRFSKSKKREKYDNQIRKEYSRKLNDLSTNNNRDKVLDKMNSDSEYRKAQKNYAKAYANYYNDPGRNEKLNGLLVASVKYEKTAYNVYKKYEKEYQGAVLKDLGFEDTESGRKYVKKLGLADVSLG